MCRQRQSQSSSWLTVADGVPAEVRLYDRLFAYAHPDAGGKDFLQSINPNSLKVVTAYVEPSLAAAQPDQKFRFERFGRYPHRNAILGRESTPKKLTFLSEPWSGFKPCETTFVEAPMHIEMFANVV